MIVMNRAISKTLSVSPHAKSRFRERSDIQQGDLMTRLCRAVPYGGQFGDNLLLIDDDVVFAVDQKDSVVLTCLTKDQAVANMQMYRRSAFRPAVEPVVKTPEIPAVPADPLAKQVERLKKDIVKMDRERCLLKIAMDEVLTDEQRKLVKDRVKGLKAECRGFEDAA